MATRQAVIVSTARTPIAKAFRGYLNLTHGADMLGHAIEQAIKRAGIEPGAVEDVIAGCGLPEGSTGNNVARIAALRAGCPVTTSGTTINRYCSSGLQAVSVAAHRIIVDGAPVVIGSGVESITRVQNQLNMNDYVNPTVMTIKGEVYMPMGQTAEVVAERYKVSRESQDAYALSSQQRTAAAQQAGRLGEEIAPMQVKFQKKDKATGQESVEEALFSQDEGNRPDTKIENLQKLQPAFKPEGGTVTAGNSSQLSDGAAAVVLMSDAEASKRGLSPLGAYRGLVVSGCEPDEMGIGPVFAIPKLLERNGLKLGDIDLIELNEAFASQTVYIRDRLGIDPEKLNVNGGAISIGHPYGMTGARQTGSILLELRRRKKKWGIVTMCIGGGMGAAALFEAFPRNDYGVAAAGSPVAATLRMAQRPALRPAARANSGPVDLWSRLEASRLGVAALILVLAFLCYFPALGGEFVLDDYLLLADNALIKAPDGLYRIWFTTDSIDYWPVANTSFWVEWRVFGTNPIGYHLVNLALHALVAWLLWRLLVCLNIPGALLAALLFTVHPVNVEAVAWIAQRKGLLAMVFFVLALRFYVEEERDHSKPSADAAVGRFYWLSLGCFVLAMLSKGSVLILPPLLLLAVGWLRPLRLADGWRAAPFFVTALVLAWVNVWFQTHGSGEVIRSASFLERLLGAGGTVWFYLYKAVVPLNLAFVYPMWTIDTASLWWWLPLLGAGATTVMLWLYRERLRPLWFAWLYFGIALFPVMGFADVGYMKYSLVADHYLYVALIVVLALPAALWARWRQRSGNLALLAVAPVLVVLMMSSFRQSHIYQGPLTLYGSAVDTNPESAMARNDFCSVLRDAGDMVHALEHCEIALSLEPDYAEAHNNMANILRDTSHLEEALSHYREAIRLNPKLPEAQANLGGALGSAGQFDEAIVHLEIALQLKPGFADAQFNLNLAKNLRAQAKP